MNIPETPAELRKIQLNEQRDILLAYARMKLIAQDWHGLADAAMDLREIDAELRGLEL